MQVLVPCGFDGGWTHCPFYTDPDPYPDRCELSEDPGCPGAGNEGCPLLGGPVVVRLRTDNDEADDV